VRDKRFVAKHRGGSLDLATHRLLANWAADCAEHVLPLFSKHSADERPSRAIQVARAWAKGEASAGEFRKAAVGAHAAARSVTNKAAIAAARAAGHAVATAHMADHCFGPVIYGCKAVQAAGGSAEKERAWQIRRLPKKLRQFMASALEKRLTKRRRGTSKT